MDFGIIYKLIKDNMKNIITNDECFINSTIQEYEVGIRDIDYMNNPNVKYECIFIDYDQLCELTKQEICDYLVYRYLFDRDRELIDYLERYDSKKANNFEEYFLEESQIRSYLFKLNRSEIIKILKECHYEWEDYDFLLLSEVYLSNYMTPERVKMFKKRYHKWSYQFEESLYYCSSKELFQFKTDYKKSSLLEMRKRETNSLKFFDRYDSLYEYDSYSVKDYLEYTVEISVPSKDNFYIHLENIRRLLNFELGGIFSIISWNSKRKIIKTNIPQGIYYGTDFSSNDLTIEEIGRIKQYRKYKKTGELPIINLW